MNEQKFKQWFLGEFKPEPNTKIFVLAGNYAEYEMFIHKHKLSRYEFVYIGQPEKLAGIWKPEYIRLDNWGYNQNLLKIIDMLRQRDAKEIKL